MENRKPRLFAGDWNIEEYDNPEVLEAVDEYEKQLNSDPSLDDVRLTDEMRAEMMRMIREEDEKAAAPTAAEEEEAAIQSFAGDKSAVAPAAAEHREAAAAEDEEAAVQSFAGDKSAVASAAAEHREAAAAENKAADKSETSIPLSEEDRRALEIGRKAMQIGRHKRGLRIALVAAVLVILVAGLSMTSGAGRAWWTTMWEFLVGKEAVYRTENTGELGFYNKQMLEIYADILDRTGIHPIQFMYFPDELIYNDYVVDEVIKSAQIFYQYRDTVFTVNMECGTPNTARANVLDGEILDTETVDTLARSTKATVMELAATDGEKNYIAEILYNNCCYEVYGVMPHEEFINIVKEINFY